MKPDLNKKPNKLARSQMGKVLAYLAVHCGRIVPAIELAECLISAGVLKSDGNHESKKRDIRKIVRMLRDVDGQMICADSASNGGYWIARNIGEWHDYTEARKTKARFMFVNIKKTADAVTHRMNQQENLFQEPALEGSREEWAAIA